MGHPEKECTFKKQSSKTTRQLPSTRCSRCNEVVAGDNQKLLTSVTGATNTSGGGVVAPVVSLTAENDKVYNTRFFYSSKVVPTEVEALLARRPQNCTVLSKNFVRSRFFSRTGISSLCKVSQVVPETCIGLGANQIRSSIVNNDISQPIAHPSTVNGDDVLHNAFQRTNYSPQVDGTTGMSRGFESTGPGFESRGHGYMLRLVKLGVNRVMLTHSIYLVVLLNPTVLMLLFL